MMIRGANAMNAGSSITPFQIIFVVIIVLIIAVVGGMIIRYDRRRKLNNLAIAEQLGFTAIKKLPKEILRRVKMVYQTSTRVKAFNIAYKQMDGRDVYVMDVSYSNMRAENGEVEYRAACMIDEVMNLPFFLMLYQFDEVYGPAGKKINQLMKIAVQLLGMKKVSFNHPAFEQKYHVYGFKEEEIRRVFTAQLLVDLSGTNQWLIRAEGDCVCFNTYAMQKGGLITIQQMQEQLENAQRLLGWLTE